MNFNLNDIKVAIESTPGGKAYSEFFQELAYKHFRKNKTFNFLDTNRKCVRYLLKYYNINNIDMASLYECVKKDPDIQNTQSRLYSQLTSIINQTRNQGEKNEDLVIKWFYNNYSDVKEIIKTSGEGSYIDMFQKIDLVMTLSDGEKYFIQVKPEGERITSRDKKSPANVYAYVDKDYNVRIEYKGGHNG